jgi:AraC-like DNA-binding protein
VGAIRFPPRHPRWYRLNDIPGLPVLLFPRRAVRIEPLGGGGGLVDAGCAIFLDSEERYARECLTEDGDRTDWFAFSDEFLSRLVPDFDPSEMRRRQKPRRFPVAARELALQRRAFRHALLHPHPDDLLVEEALCTLLDAAGHAGRRHPGDDEANPTAHRRLVEDLRAVLARQYADALGLAELARIFHASPPHLCRVFRAATGRTIHAYREHLRLAAGLERLENGERNLTGLALDLGYSSHAHFTANFTRAFGVPPSRMRAFVSRGAFERPG